MEAVVLAGGFGTRLRHIVSDVPKPMAPVDRRPFLRFLLDDLTAKGIDRIILAVGYKWKVIEQYFGNFYRGARILYSIEDKPLFTGGAIKKALKLCKEEEIFIINGDTFFDIDLEKMLVKKRENSCKCILAAKRMVNFSRYGALELNGEKISAFLEKKPTIEGVINGGVYCIDRTFLDDETKECFSFETEILEPYAKQQEIFAFICEGYFIDIGIPEDYKTAQLYFAGKNLKNKAAFFDRDGTINVEVNYLHKCEDLRFIEGMPQFIKKWNDWNYKVIVVTNQAGIARGMYTEDEMHKLHKEMNRQLAEFGAKIDAFYFCPHHPEITGPCHCRKPEPGMVESAIWDFDILPEKSILFGDKPWDIECGEKCGIRSYMV